jgi:serine protease DegS
MKHPITFIARTLITVLLIALLVMILRPDLLTKLRPVVEIRQSMGLLGDRSNGPVSYADAVATAAPAVVNVYSSKQVMPRGHSLLSDPVWRKFYGSVPEGRGDLPESSLGSGVLISSSGYILTNLHVIEGAETISVALPDGRGALARLVGADRETDLAILQIELADLPSITLGHSQDLRVGDVVMAIGNPFSVGQTVTMGIVSATGRSKLGINTIENFIQTDAAINPGNSGGALINAYGELVGINTAIFSGSGGSQGIGFAVPIALAQGVMEQIIEHGEVIRGWLGIETRDISRDIAKAIGLGATPGVLVAGVFDDSPAGLAGLKAGDIITHVSSRAIGDSHDLLDKVTAIPPGTEVEIRGLRDGREFSTRARVYRRPAH